MDDKGQPALTEQERKGVDLLIAGAKIAGREVALSTIEFIYGDRAVEYARRRMYPPPRPVDDKME